MKFCNRKDLMLLTTVLCGVAGLGANAAKAEFVPTLKEKSVYTVSKVENWGPYVFGVYTGFDEQNTAQYDYYKMDLNPQNLVQNSGTISEIESWRDSIISFGGKYYAYTPSQDAIFSNRLTVSQNGQDFSTNFKNLNAEGDYDPDTYSAIDARGGAIENTGVIGHIVGDFIRNSAQGGYSQYYDEEYGSFYDYFSLAYGGAIYNAGTFTTLTGDFIYNYVSAYDSSSSYSGSEISAYAGAIYNASNASIDSITGDFINNYALADDSSSSYSGIEISAYAGAIYNASNASIDSITGDFISNFASASNPSSPSDATFSAYGGAIYNAGTFTTLTGDFIYNYVSASNPSSYSDSTFSAYGGAIYNAGTFITLTGDFINNSASASNPSSYSDSTFSAYGGAIYNAGTFTTLTGDFIYNVASDLSASGGAIYNAGTFTTLTGDFINNYVSAYDSSSSYSGSEISAYAGAIYNASNASIDSITGDFINNYALAYDSSSSYSGIEISAYAGAIYNASNASIDSITGDFISNYASASNPSNPSDATFSAYGGAIYNKGTINNISGDFINNYADSSGDNYHETYANGGAIYNTGTIGFMADASDMLYENDIKFQGNITGRMILDEIFGDMYWYGTVNEAIYNAGSSAVLNFKAQKGGSYTFYDYINGDGRATINFESDGTGILNLYNDIKGQAAVNFNGGYTIATTDGEIKNIVISNLNVKAKSKLNLDADLAAKTIDSFKLTGNNTGAGNLSLNKLNILTDMDDDVDSIILKYASAKFTKADTTPKSVSTSKNIYVYENTGSSLTVRKYSNDGGYVNFLLDSAAIGAERSYSFTEDETIKHDGFVVGNASDLTIAGQGHLLLGKDKEGTRGLKLAEGQKANVSDLTLSGFDTALETAGELALNGVTIKDSNTGIKLHQDVTFSGVNTFEGNGTDIEVPAETYPFTNHIGMSLYYDYMLAQEAANAGISYEDALKQASELSGVTIKNGSDLLAVDAKDILSNVNNELELVNQYWHVDMSKDVYDSYVAAVQNEPNMLIVYGNQAVDAPFLTPEEVKNIYDSENPHAVAIATAELQGKKIAHEQGITDTQFWTELASTLGLDGQYGSAQEVVDTIFDELPGFEISDLDLLNLLNRVLDSSGQVSQEEYNQLKTDLEAYPEFGYLILVENWTQERIEQEKENYDRIYAASGAPDTGYYFEIFKNRSDVVLSLAEDAVLNLGSKVDGNEIYGLTFKGSKDSLISLGQEATINKADLVLDGPTLKLADESKNLANVNSFEARSGTLDLQNDVVRALVAQDFSVTGAINLLVDADLANKTMDTLGDVRVDGGSINVSGIKILSDGLEDLTQIDFAGEEYKDKVSTSVKEVLSTQYTYKVVYNAETGQFEFVREKELAPEEVIINQTPAVANAGAVMLTEAVSQKVLNTDSIKSQGASSGDAFGLKAWVQTFGSRDDVELKHLSPTIDAKFYGVLGGIDSKTFAYDNSVKATYGVYGAYTRSEQKYSGNKIKQKGGYFGLKALFEKGGLFSKLTANMGFLNNEALTEWGKDKFDTKVISAATQTGYDFKLKPSKVPFNLRGEKPFYEMNMDVTITPSLYVGYMGIDTDDYTSKAGTAIKNKFMNVVEIAPELKVANNFGNGLEGYLKGAYKMFIYDNDQVRVDTALLPSMSVKPYVEYGFGFEKTFNSAKAYADIMRHDGGKRGWDFNLGIKLEF